MKFIKKIIVSSLFFIMFAQVVCAAPIYIHPYRTLPGKTYEESVKNYGTFIGIYDKIGRHFNGEGIATSLNENFHDYGFSGLVSTSKINDPYVIRYSTIRDYIRAEAYNIKNFFPNVENYILYISGHGGPNPYRVRVHSNGQEYQLFINADELKTCLGYIPPEINKLVFIDSCHSGGFIDVLKELDNIAIITSASPTSTALYRDADGIPLFSDELDNFFRSRRFTGFSFNELVYHLKNGEWKKYLEGIQAYPLWLGIDEPIIASEEHFNIQSYQSPKYSEPVPEPSTILLFGLGLICLTSINRRKLQFS